MCKWRLGGLLVCMHVLKGTVRDEAYRNRVPKHRDQDTAERSDVSAIYEGET